MNRIHSLAVPVGVILYPPRLQRFRRVPRLLAALTALVLAALSLSYHLGAASSQETLSKAGSTGNEVRQIQTRLKDWGYYKGSVDGVYGTKTKDAVAYFQRKHGLTADGIAGPATLAAIGLPTGSSSGGSGSGSSSNSNVSLLARLISAEARGEPYTGQVAVGAVVLNRMEHPSYPDTMAGVIYQKGAFSCVDDGQFNQPVAESAYRAARDALNGWDPAGGAIYYYNPAKATNQWIRSRPVVTTIGTHIFCM